MAVPKIFQTFNSLLGGITRKKNATIVGPSKQLVGEFPEVDFQRLYQYYHHWDQIKTALDVMHQKFRGNGVSIESNNEYFNVFIKKWWDIANAEKKWSQYIFSLLITGSAIMEIQYTPDKRIGNIEQIPMQTIYRVFRDQFGNELKIVQIVDGVFKELDPQFFIHQTINNPDRQAFGKSMFHTLASPRPIAGTVDPFTGDAINPSRQSIPLLDAQAELQNAEIEIKKKMAKPRLIVSANGMPKEQMTQIQAEMSDPNTEQYIWIFDKPVESRELQVQANGKFDEYQNNIDAHIDVGTVFASNVIKNPQGFSYSGSQTPFDVLDQRMMDLQTETLEIIKDNLLRPLAESWGFKDFDQMDVKVIFVPTVKRLTMDDINALDSEAVSKKEKREMYKKLSIPLNDILWEEEQRESKNNNAQNGMPPNMMQPNMMQPKDTTKDTPNKTGGVMPPPDKKDNTEDGSSVKAPKTPQIPKTPFEDDRPVSGEVLNDILLDNIIKQIVNESTLSVQNKIECVKALERITLPSNAGNTYDQGEEEDGLPEITDPSIKKDYGLVDKDEATSTDIMQTDKAKLHPADNTKGRHTNKDILDKDTLGNDTLGNDTQGGTGNDGINQDSDGSFKDPSDVKGKLERTREEGSTINKKPFKNKTKEAVNPNNATKKMNRDLKIGEDPMTSGIIKHNDDEPRIPIGDYTNTTLEKPQGLSSRSDKVNTVPPFDKIDMTNNTVDDNTVDDNTIDDTELNVKPDYKSVSQDDYMKRVQDGSNPLEQNGDPLEDGMIIKPQETQQFDEIKIDPNAILFDPEEGRNFTELTDEQGNPVPDLRFDQTTDSDEEQPNVEPKYEIKTQEDYAKHKSNKKRAKAGVDEINTEHDIFDDGIKEDILSDEFGDKNN